MTKKFLYLGSLFLLLGSNAFAQLEMCKAYWDGDTLILKNDVVEQKMIWQQGELHNLSLGLLSNNELLLFDNTAPSVTVFEEKLKPAVKSLKIEKIKGHFLYPDHLQAHVITHYPSITLKRVFKIYPGAPAIACKFFYKDVAINEQKMLSENHTVQGIEEEISKPATGFRVSNYGLLSKHWLVEYVSLQDITDLSNNMVKENHMIPYGAPKPLVGNVLFAQDRLSGNQFYLLKESPLNHSQVNYPGADFIVSNKEISVTGVGIPFTPVQEWEAGYTITTGFAGKKHNPLLSLRKYLKASNHYGQQHEMIMMNTWGDRGQDGEMSEKFTLREIEAGKRLGITHLQLDDGWQHGLSKNSATTGGSLWGEWPEGSWEPHAGRFPNGLDKSVKAAKKAGIQIGLWFNPTRLDSYANWERDAYILISYYKKYGIKSFKIDGLQLPDKTAEINIRKLFDNVMRVSNGEVVFNLDVTAGKRGGYYFLNEYGNIFVQNRYTDWANYYPYHTLRNLWQLSKYVAPEKLQFEFLNNWRNADKYAADDIFAPANYDFEYLFAITLMSQPLAWFEGSNLPNEAFTAAPAIKKYQQEMHGIHRGIILPIGEEPSGRSWTGFQSLHDDKGYLLVFREHNENEQYQIITHLKAGEKIQLKKIIGNGNDFEAQVDENNRINVTLSEKNSYALWSYTVL